MGRLLTGALARAEAFLLEPVETVARPAAITLRPVVAVVSLAPRCGATTLARALAVELAAADAVGAAVVVGKTRASLAVTGNSARNLARDVEAATGERARVAGRLCLVEGGDFVRVADGLRHIAPVVVEVAPGEAAGAAVSLADHALLVCSAASEPALAWAVVTSLERVGPPPLVALNRAAQGDPDLDRWAERADVVLGRSALGARLALSGRRAHGLLGSGLSELAERCCAVRSGW